MSAIVGTRVLVLEDEPLVAMMLEDMLIELGYDVIGPASTVQEGLEFVALGGFDVAVLDINVNGLRSDPVAHALDALGKAYMFATGYGSAGVPECGHRSVIHKPYSIEQLAAALESLGR